MTVHLVIPDQIKKNRERAKQWAKSNPDKVKINKTRYRLRHPERYMLKAARDNSKAKNLEFNLEEQDIKIPSVCPVFKVPFQHGTDYAASIDRIDNTKGYVKGNIQIISRLANSVKRNLSHDQLVQFAQWILKS